MKTKWTVTTVPVAQKIFYQASRREDGQTQSVGGYWKTEAEAQTIADRLNAREAGFDEERLP